MPRYYTYIIRSDFDGSYYKGFSEQPFKRLEQHNNKESNYTSGKIPWQLICLQSFSTKKEALVREKVLKKYSHSQIEQLIKSKLNEMNTGSSPAPDLLRGYQQ
jgi:putative endonuclease